MSDKDKFSQCSYMYNGWERLLEALVFPKFSKQAAVFHIDKLTFSYRNLKCKSNQVPCFNVKSYILHSDPKKQSIYIYSITSYC